MNFIEEFIRNFPQRYFSGLFINGGVAALVYFIFWKGLKERFKNWRIALNNRVNDEQIKRELKNAFLSMLVSTVFSSIVIYLSTQGYTKVYTNINDHSHFWAYVGFFILLIIDDTWFYWMHRLLHHRAIYKFVHFEHHKSIDVNPFTAVSFHFLEPLLLTLWIFPVAFFVPTYAPVLGLLQVWGLFDNVKAHLGYEFYPAWFHKSWLGFLTSSTHHNMHHSKFNGNYGLHFRIWDKLLGTEFKDYEAEYDKIQERKSSDRK
jgi:Delta7-sterol 5-desaturase